MSDYRTIKELVIDACVSEGTFPSYEKLSQRPGRPFVESLWRLALTHE